VREYCRLDDLGKSLPSGPAICEAGLRTAMSQLGMSARTFHRILKLARTIADLEGAAEIKTHHLAEAIQYRPRRQL
jgi:magnesium chelatase family protein